MHILYFVTSHGYGHAVRTSAICNSFDPDVRVTFNTALPARFFEEEIHIPYKIREGSFDIGCIQIDGVTVDVQKTLQSYQEIALRNDELLESEVKWCLENRVDCIVSDITPFAFDVAHLAGIPSIAISNFTWFDIYSEYIGLYPEYEEMLQKMAQQYFRADLLLALYPAGDMNYFPYRKNMPVVGRRGENRRGELLRKYSINPGKHLGLIYTGNFGMEQVQWQDLERFEDWEFVGVYALPGNPSNYHLVTKDHLKYQDLSASVDCIISKMGYGVFSESLLNGIPLVYLPRKQFAEYPVLDSEIKRLGAGIQLSTEAFNSLKWEMALDFSTSNFEREPVVNSGARCCAEEIMEVAKRF